MRKVAVDFGTTNSVAATVSAGGEVRVARHGPERASGNFRSILCFVKSGSRSGPMIVAGPEAMTAYLDHGSDCRLIQSVKSMAATRVAASRTGARWAAVRMAAGC
jgi:molecular chaperone DnaK (HSP70)